MPFSDSCAVFGCKINYNDDHRVPVFKLPTKPDDLRHRWLQVLRRDDLQSFKVVYVCVNHFRQEDVEFTHKVPNGDGTYREIPRVNPKLKMVPFQFFYQDTLQSVLNLLPPQSADVCHLPQKMRKCSMKH